VLAVSATQSKVIKIPIHIKNVPMNMEIIGALKKKRMKLKKI
jgi:hypothetical protein